MTVTWERFNKVSLDIAESCIEKYRPRLRSARIGFIFRSEGSMSGGMKVIGKASKVTDKIRPLLAEDLDFIIWISKEDWLRMDVRQKRALIHHELCHCTIDTSTETAKMLHHDIEEFWEVIETHGLWRAGLVKTAEVIQPRLPDLENVGGVFAIDPIQAQMFDGKVNDV